MITIKLVGGLGNQLFQYAFGRALATKQNTELVLDHTTYTTWQFQTNDAVRNFKLDHFNIKARLITETESLAQHTFKKRLLRKIKRKIFPHQAYIFNPQYFSVQNDSYLEGFWQSEKYFSPIADEIRKELTLKTPLTTQATSLRNTIKTSTPAISLHVRRGDYANNPSISKRFGMCDIEYYKKALALLTEKLGTYSVFIFSDDIEWAKEHLPQILPLGVQDHYMSRPDPADYGKFDYEEIILMSSCDHHIIANSSFSWWGAWLNPNNKKIVIAPKQWIADKRVKTRDVIPSNWIQI